MIDTHIDLKDNLIPGRPVIVSKKNGSLYYDRMILFTHAIKDYIFETLKIPEDKTQSVRRGILFINALASLYSSIPSWSFYFKDMIKSPVCNK
jgi:hypothetical protein